jgi:hypothetical protein
MPVRPKGQVSIWPATAHAGRQPGRVRSPRNTGRGRDHRQHDRHHSLLTLIGRGNLFIFCSSSFASRLEIRLVRSRHGRLPG